MLLWLRLILIFSVLPFGKAQSTGVYNFPRGDPKSRVKFEGQLKNGLPHGYGSLLYKSGIKSEGLLFDFKKDGCNVITYPENSGEQILRQDVVFKNDHPIFKRIQFRNGIERYVFTEGIESTLNSKHGTEIYPDVVDEKLYYQGYFKTDSSNGFEPIIKIPHGIGSLTYKNFTRYDGTFQDGNLDGIGTILHFDSVGKNYKKVYEGQIKNGERNGVGDVSYSVHENSEEIVRYEGQFVNNTPHGVGKMTFKDGSTFQGGFKDGRISGFGKFIYTEKTIEGKKKKQYEGQLDNTGKPDGLGEIKFTDGSVYQGTIKNGIVTGFGTFTFGQNDEREFYQGEMKNGKPNGRGILHYKSKKIYEGDIKNGEPHGSGALKNKIGKLLKKGTWENGVFKQEDFSEYFYQVTRSALTFEEAVDYCKNKSGLLAEPLNIVQLDALKFYALTLEPIRSYWIGLTDSEREGTFTWVSSNSKPVNTDWYYNQPDNNHVDGEDCVEIKHDVDYSWNDMHCSTEIYGICQFKKLTYFTSHMKMNFDEANKFCKDNDATLAEIRNEYQKAKVRLFLRSIKYVHLYPAEFWIGLTDRESEGIYQWESDKSVSTFYNWFYKNPDNYDDNEDCVNIDILITKWNDFDCDQNLFALCQM